jgi:hypothetical protein
MGATAAKPPPYVTKARPLSAATGPSALPVGETLVAHESVGGGTAVSAAFAPECRASYAKVGQSLDAAPHTPPLQTLPASQALPQAPQLTESKSAPTHTPPHDTDPEAQPHTPSAHACRAAHAAPHAPQLFESVETSTQRCKQRVCPGAHGPESGTGPASTAESTPPSGLARTAESAGPPSGTPGPDPIPESDASCASGGLSASGGVSPPPTFVQVAFTHTPSTPQLTPHAPQLAGSLASSTHEGPHATVPPTQSSEAPSAAASGDGPGAVRALPPQPKTRPRVDAAKQRGICISRVIRRYPVPWGESSFKPNIQ